MLQATPLQPNLNMADILPQFKKAVTGASGEAIMRWLDVAACLSTGAPAHMASFVSVILTSATLSIASFERVIDDVGKDDQGNLWRRCQEPLVRAISTQLRGLDDFTRCLFLPSC